ncbi:hypothetical protein ACJIZ3_018084 [Penstemon smallii]|uniref:Glycosyltransferase n=1 Tax=Penstemon smallii TaxID=265156 RepID=A0ABD3SYQ5_9LAMI
MVKRHILLATFPAQGHINPSLQLAKRLINMGIQVTFFTSVYASKRMAKTTGLQSPNGITLVSFSDGYDEGLKPGGDGKHYMSEMKNRGLKALRDTLCAKIEQGHPVTCLVYSHLFAWAAEVARENHIPSALLWIEPATVLAIYYYYFNGYEDQINTGNDEIKLPLLPLLAKRDLPSFLLPSTPERFRLLMKEKLETLEAGENKPKVLVNTFDALEPDVLKGIDKYELIGIGPLIPSAFLDGKDPSDRSFGGDLFKRTEDNYLDWLSSKPDSSVVYVSFGSLVNLPKTQMEEIAKGLLASKRPFLWVIRVNEEDGEDDAKLSCLEEVERVGKIVRWCSQLEVLSHPCLGCFVTHCGWNSALESLSFGVPVVAIPQWFDQGTNAKLIEDVWGTGVRVKMNEDGGFESGEILRCVDLVMDGGDKSQQLKQNAKKWKTLAKEAMEEGEGSSNKNLMAFLQET